MKPISWLNPGIKLVDGVELSIQASCGHYCSPRDNDGPYTKVEVAYYGTLDYPEADIGLRPFRDSGGDVFGYVLVAVVLEVIRAHGGVAPESKEYFDRIKMTPEAQ